jgi:dTDP-4-dehydrorhamnose reductase
MLKLFSKSTQVSIVNDQYGSPTNSIDLSKSVLEIIENPGTPYGVYHYCNTGSISWFQFAQEIATIYNNRFFPKNVKILPIFSVQSNYVAIRPTNSTLNTTKIQKTLNMTIPSWKDSLHKFLTKYLEELYPNENL